MCPTFKICDIVSDINQVPESWIYKYYYELYFNINTSQKRYINQPFDGRIIKVQSFKNRDSDPSLCFYYKNDHYLWYDFSYGQGGDCVQFVATIYSKTREVSKLKIMTEYEQFLQNGGEYNNINVPYIQKCKPKFIAERKCFELYDLNYWADIGVDIEALNYFNIRRLSKYDIVRNTIFNTFTGFNFGFYTNEGKLYQIYQPHSKPKYINVDTSYLIGRDQLKFESDTCIIISGLKDIIAITAIDLDAEYVSGSSESTLISADDMKFLRSKYKNILCMLDNDSAGIKAMMKYKAVYNIPYVKVNLQKDLADNNKYYLPNADGKQWLQKCYSFHIDKKINEY